MNGLNSKEHAVFTVCNLSYLPKALVLADSLLKHCKIILKIYLIDRKCDALLPDFLAEYIWIEDVGVPELYELAFKYDITEFSTCVKPFITLKLLDRFDKVVFLDPDTCVYNSIKCIYDELDVHPIILTPHYITPHKNDLADSDLGMMRFGSFNLGFFAVNRSTEALSFLRWWSDRCFRFCYFEAQFGLSTDQKWVSVAPCFFQNLYVSFNKGYNMAFWNLHERFLDKSPEGCYVVNGKYPLIFFHFSSFHENNPKLLSKRWFPERGGARVDWLDISEAYSAALKMHNVQRLMKNYAFDYMSNGDYISPTLRRAYACVLKEFPCGHDPFDANGPVGKFAIKNNLVEKAQTPYVSDSYGEMSNHKAKFILINFFMRLVLRILGPNRFSNFSRLLVYLSSYRQNRNLWKL